MPATKRSLTKHHLLTDDYYKRLRAYNRTSPPRTRLAKTMAAASARSNASPPPVSSKPRPAADLVDNFDSGSDAVDIMEETSNQDLMDPDPDMDTSMTDNPVKDMVETATVAPSKSKTTTASELSSSEQAASTKTLVDDDEDLLENFGERYQKYAKQTLEDLRKKLPTLTMDANNIINCPGTPLDGVSMMRLLHCASTPFARPDLPSGVSDYLQEQSVPLRNHLMRKDSEPDVPGWTCFYRQ